MKPTYPNCPNKETDLNKCEWRGKTCFLCDYANEELLKKGRKLLKNTKYETKNYWSK